MIPPDRDQYIPVYRPVTERSMEANKIIMEKELLKALISHPFMMEKNYICNGTCKDSTYYFKI
jgi:hypothetical protein